MEEMHTPESAEIEEMFEAFNEILMEKPESFKKMYKQFYDWWQSIVYWNGELGIC
jgi:hypothetical protein